MSEDVQKLAAGLSEAQRKALVSATFRKAESVWHPEGLYFNADRRVRWALSVRRLSLDYLRPWNRLTPLGLAVRAALLSGRVE